MMTEPGNIAVELTLFDRQGAARFNDVPEA
jgi:hypothetical protein